MNAARPSILSPFGILALGAVILLPGCDFGNTVEETREYVLAHEPGMPLKIEAKNGSIKVRQGGTSEVRITAVIRARTEERLSQTAIITDRLGEGTLSIEAAWPGKREGNEGCSFIVEIPDVSKILLTTSNGRVDVTGLTGPLEARTSNGKVEVERHNGDVLARSSNGRIEVQTNGNIDVETSNGRIHLKMGDKKSGSLRAISSNGRIKLDLGDAWQGTIDARTSNGRIKVDDASGVAVTRHGRHRADIARGQGKNGTVRTSNGTIEVRFR